MNFEYHFNVINDYLTNIDKPRYKKSDFLGSITFLENHNYNLQELEKQFTLLPNMNIFRFKMERDIEKYTDLCRKIIISNYEENFIKNFTKNNAINLFYKKILIDEDFVFFKEPIIIEIRNRIKNKTSRFKYFKEFLDTHYNNNNIKENNILISQLFILRDCNYLLDYLDNINDKGLNYSLEAFLLTNPEDLFIKNPEKIDLFSFSYKNSLSIIEDTISKLIFYDVNKLILTKVIKHHGFSLFSILLLIRCIKYYKVNAPDFKLIFDLIGEFKEKFKYEDFHDNYLNDYFILCFTKNYYKPDIEILNLCSKFNCKKLFETLIDRYKIKPSDDTLEIIIKNINSKDPYLLEKMLEMKFILTNDQLNNIFINSKFNYELRKLLIKTNYIELNETIFEKYIKYGNVYNDQQNILNEFVLDKNNYDTYFEIIHKYNIFNDYKYFSDFLETKLHYKKKQLRHYLEFSKSKYKDIKEIEEYLSKTKLEINKYCVDNCMKGGNYECGIYLINKFNIKPDNYTALCIKDIQNRIKFYSLYF